MSGNKSSGAKVKSYVKKGSLDHEKESKHYKMYELHVH